MASASPLAASIAAALPGCGADLAESVAQYLRFDPRPETVEAVTQLTAHGVDVVKEHFTPRIAFGTAGLRAAMAPGSVTNTRLRAAP
jgi:phosphomannomutase